MIILKACPRCGGDLLRSADGEYACLQCGHELTAEQRHDLLLRRPDTVVRLRRAA